MRPTWILPLVDAEEQTPLPPPREDERSAAIDAITAAIERRGKRRARMRLAWTLAAAAAVVLAIGLGGLVARRGLGQQRAQVPAPAAPVVMRVSGDGVVVDGALAPAATLAKGQRVAVRDNGRAAIALATGTELALEERGDVTVVDDGRAQIFALSAGTFRARVAKLGAGERFVVRTPDAEVEVRGTVFTVSLVPADAACGEGTITRVLVDEGVVAVRRQGEETRVAKGERWPTGCEATPTRSASTLPAETAAPSTPATPPTTTHVTTAAPKPSATTPAAISPSSNLAEQNSLFAEGLALKNGGQTGQAIGVFEKLMGKYPSSPLAENAAVERMRLLASIDRGRAASAASQYLKRYPEGFGKAEAKALVANGP